LKFTLTGDFTKMAIDFSYEKCCAKISFYVNTDTHTHTHARTRTLNVKCILIRPQAVAFGKSRTFGTNFSAVKWGR